MRPHSDAEPAENSDDDLSVDAVELLDRQTGRVRVLTDKCRTCILRPGNPAMLQAGRVRHLIEDARDNFVACHSTLAARDVLQPALCRGWFDAYGDSSPVIVALTAVYGVHEVDLAAEQAAAGGRTVSGGGGAAGADEPATVTDCSTGSCAAAAGLADAT